MNVGMLWFDNNPKADLATKIARAAEYYRSKYGAQPNLCFVHPGAAQEGKAGEIQVRSSRSILKNHLWMGVEDV